MWKTLGALVTIVIAIVLAVAAWPQFFGLEQTLGVAQVVSLRGLAIVVAVVLAIVFLLFALAKPLRAFAGTMAGLLILFAVASAIVVVQRGITPDGTPTTGQDDSSSEITVLSWNTLGDSVDASTIAAVAVKYGANVIALPETTAETADAVATAMAAAARPMISHTVSFGTELQARSTSLLISTGLGAYSVTSPDVPGENANTSVLPSVVAVPEHGKGPTIVAVHAVAPLPAEMDAWRSDLQWLSGLCADDTNGTAETGAGNTILAGDFNATVDNMWKLRTGTGDFGTCHDAAVATGTAGLGTWPTSVPAQIGSPIDHVMSTNEWTTSKLRVLTDYDQAGSDHRPIVATLQSRTAP